MNGADDTITALATPDAPAARAIIRTSGPAAFELARMLGAGDLAVGRATRAALRLDGLAIDVMCLAFARPRSHTGEDVVEYHLPGNAVLCRYLLQALMDCGARPAQPGEFTARAYFNGKIRLDQAEAVQAAIAATSDAELTAAARLRAGELARRLQPLMDELATLLALCEAGIDFTDEEDIVALPADEAEARISALTSRITALKSGSTRFERLARPPTVALVGRPNAGKSTLFNALAGHERAVASPLAGTTRDVLSAVVPMPGGEVELLDLAGIGEATGDLLDTLARDQAHSRAAEVDVLVLVMAGDDPQPAPMLPRAPDVVVRTKADLIGGADVSAVTGAGLDGLRRRIADAAHVRRGSDRLALTARHAIALDAAVDSLVAAQHSFASGAGEELCALPLREALDHLGGILGTVTPDDLLGRIFSTFCVGK